MTTKPDLKIIIIDSIKYVECDKVMDMAPIYSKGAKNTRGLVKIKKIPEDMFTYAKKNKNNKWELSDGKSMKFDKIFLKKEFVDKIPEINKKKR